MAQGMHATEVAGYEGRLQELAQEILRMRYDRVEEFFKNCAAELNRQATEDRTRGRIQLATLLEAAANSAELQQQRFARIWALCEPYM